MEFLKLIILYTLLIYFILKINILRKYADTLIGTSGLLFFYYFFYRTIPERITSLTYFSITLLFLLTFFFCLNLSYKKTTFWFLNFFAITFLISTRLYSDYFNWGLNYIVLRLIWLNSELKDGLISDKISFKKYLSFVFYFPSTFTGPLFSYSEYHLQIKNSPNLQLNKSDALLRFAWGCAKLFILALTLQPLLPNKLLLNGYYHGLADVAFSLSCFYIYVYFNFSGAIDIIIASAQFSGIQLPENFNNPFKAQNLNEFWGRWHISLTLFLKFHIFFPTQKFLVKRTRISKSISILTSGTLTMLAMGLWHGFQINFIIYGLLHGLGLGIYFYYNSLLKNIQLTGLDFFKKTQFYSAISWLLTHSYIAMTLLFFSCSMNELEMLWKILVFKV